MAEQTRIQELFDRYLRRECTPGEVEELARLLQDKDNREMLTPRMFRLWDRIKGEQKIYPVNWEGMYDRVVSNKSPFDQKRTSLRRMSLLIAAAAVAFLILCGGLLWYIDSSRRQAAVQIAVHGQQDVLPGGNRAVLTLGNGTTIQLNQRSNGTLANQGNAQIVKLDSGQLAYRPVGKTSSASEIQYNTLATPRGGQYQLELPDGTKVWLNAVSSIRYPTAFEGKQREVTVSGEVYFEVADNPEQPFIVEANNTRIKVLGTHFNVNAYPDETSVKTTLLEGRVKVRSLTDEGREVTMVPGQQVRISKNGKMKVIQEADVDEAVAWKNGLFIFHSDDLAFIMQQLSRWYDIQVKYDGGQAPVTHFTGAIRRNVNLSEVFKMLELTGGAHFKIEGKTVIVSR
jgi:ferric-dicitrate binding protein FerR (iron transport regulator)